MEEDTRKVIELLNEEIIQTRRLANAAWSAVEELKKLTVAIERKADAAERKVDAAWELVIMTRNQMEQRTQPWWKKRVNKD